VHASRAVRTAACAAAQRPCPANRNSPRGRQNGRRRGWEQVFASTGVLRVHQHGSSSKPSERTHRLDGCGEERRRISHQPTSHERWARTAPLESRSARARAMRVCGWVDRPGRWRSLVQPETGAAAEPVDPGGIRPRSPHCRSDGRQEPGCMVRSRCRRRGPSCVRGRRCEAPLRDRRVVERHQSAARDDGRQQRQETSALTLRRDDNPRRPTRRASPSRPRAVRGSC
jgi:hypothetical protein